MTKSRFAPGLILLLAASPAAAQQLAPLSADDDAKLRQAMHTKADPCTGDMSGDIIVCARLLAGHGERMEFEREPGEIVRHINEAGSGVAALAADHCTRLCDVGVSINLIQGARAAPKILRHMLGKD